MPGRSSRCRASTGPSTPTCGGFVGGRPRQNAWRSPTEVPAETAESKALSRDLVKRGFRFVGPTICYAFMQAVGMVNDHTVDCFRWRQVQRLARRGHDVS